MHTNVRVRIYASELNYAYDSRDEGLNDAKNQIKNWVGISDRSGSGRPERYGFAKQLLLPRVFRAHFGILVGPGVGHLIGLGAAVRKDTVLQNSCCGPVFSERTLEFWPVREWGIRRVRERQA